MFYNLSNPPTKGPSVTYKVVEMEPAQRIGPPDKAMIESLETLNSHPGFIYLTKRLASVRAAIKAKLETNHSKDVSDYHDLQQALFWSGWLQSEVATATKRPIVTTKTDPYEEELEAFKAIDSLIERVGQDG